ncbi:MAG: serine/threonine-protein kinase [Planctomycetaceae bacterium]
MNPHSNSFEGQSPGDLPTILQPGAQQDDAKAEVAKNIALEPRFLIPGYDLMPEIARGGMGVVYAARDLTFDREVAIKIMKPGMDAAQFNREARITARLPHPGVPPVYALGTIADGRPFLAMKLVRGDTLNRVLKSHTYATVDRTRLIAIFEQVCHAVGYAHAQGIVHRDLKPSNVMVGAFGEVQVMDWGLAKEIGGAESEFTSHSNGGNLEEVAATIAGKIKGTPAYMAPEQARGEPVDARADVFALAGILAAILTGHPPFSGNSVVETLIRAANGDLKETFERLDLSGVDSDLLHLCKQNLSPAAKDRCCDATAFASAVAEYRAAVEERFRRIERDRAAAQAKEEEIRKHRKVRFALAASVVLLAIVGTFGVVVSSFWRMAESAKAAVERERERVARTEYGRAVEAAHHLVQEGKCAEALQLLESTDAQFRGWEWDYVHRLLNSQRFLANNLQAADLSADGTRIAVSQSDRFRIASVWDTRSKQEIFASQDSGDFGQLVRDGVSFFPDGARLLTTTWGTENGNAVVWDVASRRELFRLPVKDIFAAALTADGKRILTRDIGVVTVRDAPMVRLLLNYRNPMDSPAD